MGQKSPLLPLTVPHIVAAPIKWQRFLLPAVHLLSLCLAVLPVRWDRNNFGPAQGPGCQEALPSSSPFFGTLLLPLERARVNQLEEEESGDLTHMAPGDGRLSFLRLSKATKD